MARVFGKHCGPLMAAAKSTAAAAPAPRLAGILKPAAVSPALGHFLGGVKEVSRTQAVKKIWEHIKAHNLQNPSNKKEIICDAKLKSIFDNKEKVGFLEIAKLLKPHFVKSP